MNITKELMEKLMKLSPEEIDYLEAVYDGNIDAYDKDNNADLMLISTEQNQNFENNSNDCVFIDKASMGIPHTDFGKLLIQQDTINDKLIEKVKVWYEVLEHKEDVVLSDVITWMEKHRGEFLETECW